MAETTDKPQPRLTDRAEAEHAARRAREAAALRANLRRRKEQARARETLPGLPLTQPLPGPLPQGEE